MKNEKGKKFADSNITLNTWKNYFSRLLNSHDIIDAKQTGVLMYVLFESRPTPFESDIATES
jgi:hypothetical protein